MAQHTLTLNALKITSALIIGACLPMTASALSGPDAADKPADMQDHTPQTDWQAAPVPGRADYFAAADLNSDGGLTPNEFSLFADTLAERGDADMEAVQTSGEYAEGFAAADVNADGVVTYDEVMITPAAIAPEIQSETETRKDDKFPKPEAY